MVAGAADMIRRRGLNATSIRDLAEHAGAPLGSTYHYFPGGKQQLAAEAVRFAGDTVTEILRRKLDRGPVEGLRAFLDLWRTVVSRSDFRAGCPVLAVSVEEPADDEAIIALDAAASAFETWERLLFEALRGRGVGRREASELATLVVAAVEGGVALCRAKRSIEPLDRIAGQLQRRLKQAVDDHENRRLS
jgi:AcrR family transcriptional regulator